jgi:YfiH family protein
MFTVELPGGVATFSTRKGGVSRGPYESLNLGFLTDDEPELVAENRGILAGRIGLDPAAIGMGLQVHGPQLKRWDAVPEPGAYDRKGPDGMTLDRVDGHLTALHGLGVLVLVADCYPVALAGAGGVAMLHCGWRGVAAGIVGRAVSELGEVAGAAVGPGIGRCCYEVGEEVLREFADVPAAAQGRKLDLRAVIELRLRAAGVENVEHVDLCTSCREDLFFSHRRDAGVTGRQAGLIVRAET